MKKVLFIITKSVWGGAQKYVFDIAVNLPSIDFKTAVAGGGNGPMAEKIKSAGLPYFEIKNFQRDINFLKEIFAFFEILKILFKTKPDIVHVSSSKAGGLAGTAFFFYKLFFMRNNPRAIFVVHGWAFLESRPKWQIGFIKLASKITCLFYDKIICVSENDYKEAIKNKIASAKKITVIHNGIKPEDYDFEERTEKEFTVGTIGEAVKNKGHKYLAEAMKNFPEIKLNIVSNVPNASRYLKNFDIFVLPSIKEGLPYAILEAGLAGLPVIASNIGGIPEIIENEKDGLLVPPANPEKLSEAIKKLINNKTLCETFARNLNEKIKKDFSLGKMVKETIKTY